MSSNYLPDLGEDNSTMASGPAADSTPLEWTIDQDKGCIQGPLELDFLRGRKLSLILEEGQQAILLHEGQLLTLYPDGVHSMEIGSDSQQIDPSCQLIFLVTNEPLHLSWSRALPLRWGPEVHQTLIGSCALRIQWPDRFFGTFLQGQLNPDPEFTERLIDQIVRGLFEDLLAPDPETGLLPSATAAQARLTRVSPPDLNEELNACGLSCTGLAVYTSAPPIENDPATATRADPATVY